MTCCDQKVELLFEQDVIYKSAFLIFLEGIDAT